MATITESEALAVVGLAHMKDELRIPSTETSHDDLLTHQITDATNFVSTTTGAALADLPRPAIVAIVRQLYDGLHEVTPNAAHNAWMQPFKSYERG